MTDDRDRGIQFGDLTADLEAEQYPLSKQEVLSRYGDRRLEHASGSTTVREVLSGEGDGEYEDADAVHQALLNMVGDQAIGREDYTDRSAGTAEREGDEQSF